MRKLRELLMEEENELMVIDMTSNSIMTSTEDLDVDVEYNQYTTWNGNVVFAGGMPVKKYYGYIIIDDKYVVDLYRNKIYVDIDVLRTLYTIFDYLSYVESTYGEYEFYEAREEAHRKFDAYLDALENK